MLTDLERDRLQRIGQFMQDEYGYIAIQSTRPQTLAYGLIDSPVGQLAWMLDKFKAWTWPPEAMPDDVLGAHRVLEHVSLYWFTGTAGTSAYVGYAARPGDRHRNPPPHPPRSLNSHTTSASDRSSNASTTSNVGPTSTTADTSPPWKNPESSLMTSAHSSGACADHSALRTKTYVCVDIPVRESGRVEMQREVIRSSLCRGDAGV